ncbi:MAG: alcohol dehydrogenase catalytic domain-containing protein [Chloroflexota bacterium]|nr:alcohol dehydrogenase catalytic domain-containing protein [Chloroflexota bacterium]
MKAIQFVQSIPRYLLSRAIGTFYRPIFWSRLSCLRLCEVPVPPLPNESWARIKVRYGGICGTDMGTIFLHSSPLLSAFTSFPFTLGHESVGTIAELGSGVEGFALDERVVANPVLSCAARGFTELCTACRRGDPNLCRHFTEGDISPGLLIGGCRDTGGSWSPFFVAHKSQLLRVPASVNDENGVMVEPFSVALHAAMRNYPHDNDTVLIVGSGVIGLCVVAALRALGSKAQVIALAKYPFQAEMARRYVADQVIRLAKGYYDELARALGATLHKPIMGKQVVIGGADLVFDCVGSGSSIDDALRFTRSGGRMVLIGAAALPKGIDWTFIWLNEIEIKGSYTYGIELYQGKRMHTFEVALDLMAKGKVDLTPLVTRKFKLKDYRQALATVANKGRSGAIKAVFAFD